MLKQITNLFLTFLVLAPFYGHGITPEKQLQIMRERRRVACESTKTAVTQFDGVVPAGNQGLNGDQQLYSNLRGNFGKALNHEANGYIQLTSYNSLLSALHSGSQTSFNNIILGGARKLVNPQGCFLFSLAGNDGWINTIPPAPAFASDQTAGEMVELYWSAYLRDLPFNEYSTDPFAIDAAAELTTLSDFRGPKVAGVVTTGTLFRGSTPGDLIGPYVSQFLYQTIPLGQASLAQEYAVPEPYPDNNFNVDFTDWFAVVNGGTTGETTVFDPTPTFIRNARDLAEYVHSDYPGQPGFQAALILNSFGPAALDPANPYFNNPTQDGFVSFGLANVLELLQTSVQEALKAAWFQKWQVNRRCRPEEYGFYVQRQVVNGDNLGISSELTGSDALAMAFTQNSSYYLSQAYPEGSPTHPSYPAGHAAVMGAAVTILKAFYNEDFAIPSPAEPNALNTALQPYGGTLTVGNELNKLASNISLGRDFAGVHYRSDGYEGMNLGEKVAIDVLNNWSFLYNENFEGFTLTKFNGTTIKVGGKR